MNPETPIENDPKVQQDDEAFATSEILNMWDPAGKERSAYKYTLDGVDYTPDGEKDVHALVTDLSVKLSQALDTVQAHESISGLHGQGAYRAETVMALKARDQAVRVAERATRAMESIRKHVEKLEAKEKYLHQCLTLIALGKAEVKHDKDSGSIQIRPTDPDDPCLPDPPEAQVQAAKAAERRAEKKQRIIRRRRGGWN